MIDNEIIKYLDYLKEKQYIFGYTIEDYGLTISYGLYSVNETCLYIDCDTESDIISFLNTMLINANEIGTNIYESLIDDNDFYGYDSQKELDDRIEEETNYINNLVYNVYKKYCEEV